MQQLHTLKSRHNITSVDSNIIKSGKNGGDLVLFTFGIHIEKDKKSGNGRKVKLLAFEDKLRAVTLLGAEKSGISTVKLMKKKLCSAQLHRQVAYIYFETYCSIKK